jgi:hypothetical protein
LTNLSAEDGRSKRSPDQWVQNLSKARARLLLLDEFNTSVPSTMKGMLRPFWACCCRFVTARQGPLLRVMDIFE